MEEEKMGINRKEIFGKRAGMSYLQISILIMATFAMAYIIYQSSGDSKINNGESIIGKILRIIYQQVTKEILPSASALDMLSCCPLDNQGSACNNYLQSEFSIKCATAQLTGTTCNNYPSCKLGCCYDNREGLCTPQAPKGTCESNGGIWKDSDVCNPGTVNECRLGCCVLGSDAQFVTSQRCQKLTADAGFKLDFRGNINTELQCIALSLSQEVGACLIAGGGCKMLSGQECFSMTGKNINKGELCTAVSLNTTCTKTEETMCVEGKDEVYFKDSCGNQGNIYNASQTGNQSYWERIVVKDNSCGSSSGNVNSKECGNCNHFIGSKCKNYKKAGAEKPTYGESVCADLSCKQAPSLVDAFGKVLEKKDRRNGESWCVYDGKVGNGLDVAGSRNFKYSCIEGEVKVDPCADFRNEICVQSESNIQGGSFSSASCRINTWQSCINSNTGGTGGKCGEDCERKTVTVDKFTKSLCTPKYPAGFDMSTEGGGKAAETICGLGTGTCTIQYAATFMGGCKCVQNCACDKVGFTQKMNDLCISLGDCGGYVNIAGKTTSDGYTISKAPPISLGQYVGNSIPVAGLFILAGSIDALVSGTGGPIADSSGNETEPKKSGSDFSSTIQNVNLGVAGVGLALQMLNPGKFGNVLGALTSAGSSAGAAVAPVAGAAASGTIPVTVIATTGTGSTFSGAIGSSTAMIATPTGVTPVAGQILNVPASATASLTGTAAGGSVAGIPQAGLSSVGEIASMPGNIVSGAGTVAAVAGAVPVTVGATLPGEGITQIITSAGNFYVPTSAVSRLADGATTTLPASQAIYSAQGSPAGTTLGSATGATPPTTPTPAGGMAGFVNGIIIGAIGSLIGSFIAKALGLSGMGSLLMSTGASLIAVGVAGMMGILPFCAWCGPVGVVLIIISLFFPGSKCKPKIVTFTCKPWQAPTGGEDCNKCNTNLELKPCTKYRCQSLGQACELFNEGTGKEICATSKNDAQAPRISPWLEILTTGYNYTNIGETGFKIVDSAGGCVQAFTPLLFGIQTDKPSQCKVDAISKPKYDDMENYFGDSNLYLYNHTQGFSMPSVESIVAELNDTNFTYAYVLDKLGDTKIYVKCQDSFGNANPTEYVIDLCIKEGPDRTAPMITNIIPESGKVLAYNQTEQNVEVWVNEPADCKYSKQDKVYSAMENRMNCSFNVLTDSHGTCTFIAKNISKQGTNFYMRCLDQPELAGTVNESKRNPNVESRLYALKNSESPLRIASIEPNGTMSFGFEPIEKTLIVQTAGGSDGGKSACEYRFEGGNYVSFFETGETTHRQKFDMLVRGDYNLYVICRDVSGNIAEGMVNWKLEVDNFPPIISRVYNAGGLYIFTNENSECAYSGTTCNFVFENGTKMSGGFSQEHEAEWNTQQSYYIKCRDVWGNIGNCLKVKAYSL